MRSIRWAILCGLAAATASVFISGCDEPIVCGDILVPDETGGCTCPEGTEFLEAERACRLPDGGIVFLPDAGPRDAGDERDDGGDGGLDAQVVLDAGHDAGADSCTLTRYYRDSDGDGAGDPDAPMDACSPPEGHVTNDDDCDDTCAGCRPGADEACDGDDNDCDGSTDEGVLTTFWLDADGDGYGNPLEPRSACSMASGTVSNDDDCNDDCMACRPGGSETCDGVLDEDCSGIVDNGCVCTNGTTRACGSAVGECSEGIQTCTAGAWGACAGGTGPTMELCNGRDDDCDMTVDGPTAAAACGSATRVTATGCSAGMCIVTSCTAGYDDCDDSFANGCEVELATSETHCGSCGNACDWSCNRGSCDDATAVALGSNHSCALRESGEVVCWGENAAGQLGTGTAGPVSLTPTTVLGIGGVGVLTGVTQIDASSTHTCARLSTGTVACWGANNAGQLGDGSTTPRPYPVAVAGLTGVNAVATGAGFTCAIVSGGSVRCWGANTSGQLGNGTTSTSATTSPVNVMSLTNATQLSAGQGHICARTSASGVRCWGLGSGGRLGNGGTSSQSVPIVVSGITTATAVAAGDSHTCARLSDGSLRCWGLNGSGQLGDGSYSMRTSPVPVMDISGATAITAGAFHSCALVAGGAARCWGAGTGGALGNSTTTGTNRPVVVTGLTSATHLDAGGNHACVVRTGGSVMCWGRGTSGEIGDGMMADRSAPVATVGP